VRGIALLMTALLAGACNDGVGGEDAPEGGEDGPAPSASFMGSPTSGAAPLSVAFEDQSTGEVTSWTWDFGDGGSSNQASPSHTYVVAGLYTVRLTVRGPTGSDTFTRPSYISVGNQPPVVNFGAAPTMGVAPLAVTFADLSTGNVSRWLWNFGDGATSTLRNPAHTYANAGTYDVMLTVSGSGGTNQLLRRGFIVVRPPAPVADFRGAPTVGSAPLSVDFTDASVGATGWLWDFGDGSSSTLRNPSHTYRTSGFYNVSLAVSGPGGTDVETKFNYIAVGDLAPIATFAA
jgi:PKD repeat protein